MFNCADRFFDNEAFRSILEKSYRNYEIGGPIIGNFEEFELLGVSIEKSGGDEEFDTIWFSFVDGKVGVTKVSQLTEDVGLGIRGDVEFCLDYSSYPF